MTCLMRWKLGRGSVCCTINVENKMVMNGSRSKQENRDLEESISSVTLLFSMKNLLAFVIFFFICYLFIYLFIFEKRCTFECRLLTQRVV